MLVAAFALAAPDKSLSKSILIAVLLSVSANYTVALPSGISLPWNYERALALISMPNAGLIWWWALSLLKDDFKLDGFAWFGLIISSAGYGLVWIVSLGILSLDSALLFPMANLIPALLVLHILWIALSGLRSDLVEPRRKARIWIAALPMLVLAAILISDYLFSDIGQRLLRVTLAIPVTLVTMFWLLRFDVSALSFTASAAPVPDAPKIDPKDAAAYERLMRIIEDERAYIETDLSIGILAERVGVPAHRLRAIINQGLGYRNFYAFLAHYRILDIQDHLTDPEKARVPILTIAMDGGFSSLATFNRAFKAETGQTASAYRKEAFSE